MHKKLDNTIKSISNSSTEESEKLISFSVKETLENLTHYNFKFLFNAFKQKSQEQAEQYLAGVFELLDNNIIIDLYTNKEIEDFVRKHYKNLPSFLHNNKYVTSHQ